MRDDGTGIDEDEEVLAGLQVRFVEAVRLKDANALDQAEEIFQAILRQEPRLPEPRMELARIFLDTDRLLEAEEHARLALEHLAAGGRWTDDLGDGVVESIAHALLAEILRRRLDEDDVVFGDPEVYRSLLAESRSLFEKAHRLDPTDETSSYYASFLGPAAPDTEPEQN
jgi:tetratricopeptide (TPR) repeat protein